MMSHIFHPIPSLDTLPQTPTEEERLRNILKNLASQKKAVHTSILSTAQQTLATLPSAATQDTASAEVDLTASQKEEAQAHLVASLDFKRTTYPEPPNPPPPPSDSIAQVPLLPQFKATLEAMRLLEEYDAIWAMGRKPYERELERLRRKNGKDAGGSGAGGEKRKSAGEGREARKDSATGLQKAVPQLSGARRSSVVDESRDPRRARAPP